MVFDEFWHMHITMQWPLRCRTVLSLPGNHNSLFFHLFFFSFLLKCYVSAIIQHAVFHVWLNALSLMCLKFSHVVSCLSSFLFIFRQYANALLCYDLPIHQLMGFGLFPHLNYYEWRCLEYIYILHFF